MNIGLLAVMAALLVTGPATAKDRLFQPAEGAGRCAPALGEAGTPIAADQPLAEADRKALMAALFLTLNEPTRDEARALPAGSCTVARFSAADVVWTVHGGGGAEPARWITTSARPDWFYLTVGPALKDAAAWELSRQALPRASVPPAYYLVGVLDGINFVVRIYDGPPSMRLVAEDVAALLEGDAAPLGAHDPTGDVVSLFLATGSGPQAEVFRPIELSNGRVGALFMPDGRLVRDVDGDFVFRGSDFACRHEYGTLTRYRVGIGRPDDENVELSCQQQSDDVVMIVIVTRRPETSRDKALWEAEIRNVEQIYGVSTKLSGPPTGRGSPIRAGRTWIDKDGLVQLVLFLRQGEYVYEIRQSHPAEAIEAAMGALKPAIDQISAPPAR